MAKKYDENDEPISDAETAADLPMADDTPEAGDVPPVDEDTANEVADAEDTEEDEASKKSDDLDDQLDDLQSSLPQDDSDVDDALSPMARYKAYLDQYKALQANRQKSDLTSNLLAAGDQIGQSIAGRFSGQFNPDLTGVKMLQQSAERPVTDFEQAGMMGAKGLQLQQLTSAADPSSSQSKLTRDYLKTRLGLDLPETVSASDAQMLMKSVGRPVMTKYQKVNGTANINGQDVSMSAIFDPGMGQYIDPATRQPIPGFHAESLNPFELSSDKDTGVQFKFNKSRGSVGGVIHPNAQVALGQSSTDGKPQGKSLLQQAQTPQQFYAALGQENPELRKEMQDKIIPDYNKVTEKVQERLMHEGPIMARLKEAQINPAALAQLQAEMARFDVGDQRMAIQEFNMFATRHGYKSMADWAQKNSTGTISPDFASDFQEAVSKTSDSLRNELSKQAELKAKEVINRLPPGSQVYPSTIAPLLYGGYHPTVVQKGYNPKTNQTQFIYSDGKKEVVNGRQ